MKGLRGKDTFGTSDFGGGQCVWVKTSKRKKRANYSPYVVFQSRLITTTKKKSIYLVICLLGAICPSLWGRHRLSCKNKWLRGYWGFVTQNLQLTNRFLCRSSVFIGLGGIYLLSLCVALKTKKKYIWDNSLWLEMCLCSQVLRLLPESYIQLSSMQLTSE